MFVACPCGAVAGVAVKGVLHLVDEAGHVYGFKW